MGILTAIVVLPLVGVVLMLALPKGKVALIRGVAIGWASLVLVVSWSLLARFDLNISELQFTERQPWIPELGMTYVMGVDGLSFPMVLLTTLLILAAVIASATMIHERVKGYFAWIFLLEFSLLGVFMAQDWFLFYVFWEIGLVPMFFLIGLWGGENKATATMTFFLYTLAGSIFMLLGIIAVYLSADPHTFDMQALIQAREGWTAAFQIGPFIAFFIGFAVKIPVFPLHGWLPLAHVEAPAPVSIILSGLLLKMGAYGLLRVSGLLPAGLEWFAPFLLALAMFNIIYGAILSWRQTDLKSMVAFSSISHMGFVILGIAALNATGFSGAVFQMVTHGIITGALFLLVGIIYERTHTREVGDFGGLATRVPIYSALMSLALLASMGMPGLAQFVGEFHALVGAFQRWGLWVVIATIGILVSAAFSLRTISKMFMGTFNTRWSNLSDLKPLELLVAVPLAILMVVLGLFPSLLLRLMNTTLTQMAALFP
jgi:NADH-quinone oxidoreductase subunit M